MRYEIGGTKVREGFYWGMKSWDVQVIERGGGKLPGGDERRYVRIPALAMLGLGPIMGAVFAMFLPFIGLAMFADHAGRAIARKTAKLFGRKAEVKVKS